MWCDFLFWKITIEEKLPKKGLALSWHSFICQVAITRSINAFLFVFFFSNAVMKSLNQMMVNGEWWMKTENGPEWLDRLSERWDQSVANLMKALLYVQVSLIKTLTLSKKSVAICCLFASTIAFFFVIQHKYNNFSAWLDGSFCASLKDSSEKQIAARLTILFQEVDIAAASISVTK